MGPYLLPSRTLHPRLSGQVPWAPQCAPESQSAVPKKSKRTEMATPPLPRATTPLSLDSGGLPLAPVSSTPRKVSRGPPAPFCKWKTQSQGPDKDEVAGPAPAQPVWPAGCCPSERRGQGGWPRPSAQLSGAHASHQGAPLVGTPRTRVPPPAPHFWGQEETSPPPSLEVRRVEVHPRVGARSCAGTTEGDRGCLLRGADPPRPAPRWGRASQLPRLVQKLRKRPPPRRDSAHAARGAGFRSRDWSRRCQGGRIPAPGRESRGAARGPHRARR